MMNKLIFRVIIVRTVRDTHCVSCGFFFVLCSFKNSKQKQNNEEKYTLNFHYDMEYVLYTILYIH